MICITKRRELEHAIASGFVTVVLKQSCNHKSVNRHLYQMDASVELLESALAELFAQASLSGQITLADRYGLLAAMLADTLTDEERQSIDRLLYAVRRGQVKLVNELSALS